MHSDKKASDDARDVDAKSPERFARSYRPFVSERSRPGRFVDKLPCPALAGLLVAHAKSRRMNGSASRVGDGALGWLGIALGQRAQNPADSEVVVHPGTAATHLQHRTRAAQLTALDGSATGEVAVLASSLASTSIERTPDHHQQHPQDGHRPDPVHHRYHTRRPHCFRTGHHIIGRQPKPQRDTIDTSPSSYMNFNIYIFQDKKYSTWRH
ncbi:hypothetical protein VFPFJ_08102 [Purpureocillium lilacinum]|uniref:Uncharacterized protein n=1 Tax=Purpureocillium lilacinum TaxID=33203 RepID=A0A179H829_PURLI|nr:hypothetical protein VFPFJ_08102 [Purpureocillium lilacinum]OAQ85713.1 hypothetical protein VFPFJ_08102 [Purpureocillium lilacinum]